MGKIRVKTFGSPEQEEQEKKKAKQKREAKKTVKVPGLKGGERVVAVGPSEEEIEKSLETSKNQEEKIPEEKPSSAKASKGKKEKFARLDPLRREASSARQAKVKARSKRYQTTVQMLDKSKTYSISDALDLLGKFQKAKFDETVELHLNTIKTGILGNFTLPHGTGKKTKVAVADDKLIAEIETGKLDFDILLAKPDMMPKLARAAKILGPKGLMPNPKNGTINQNPEALIKKYEAGQTSFKTEAKSPLIHLTVGKFSFGDKKLKDNINVILEAVKPENIQKIVLKSTMSPAIKIKL